MPRTDKSVTVMTGMIIAALYVILLVGFSRESYMRRDASLRAAETESPRPVIYNVSKRVCRMESPLCAMVLAQASEFSGCPAPGAWSGRLASEPLLPLTLEGLRRAMRAAR